MSNFKILLKTCHVTFVNVILLAFLILFSQNTLGKFFTWAGRGLVRYLIFIVSR